MLWYGYTILTFRILRSMNVELVQHFLLYWVSLSFTCLFALHTKEKLVKKNQLCMIAST